MGDKKMMACGHAANATDGDGNPCCVICMGTPESKMVTDAPNLEGRMARCCYCKCEVPSAIDLAFFEHCLDDEHDRYYCGCRGWD